MPGNTSPGSLISDPGDSSLARGAMDWKNIVRENKYFVIFLPLTLTQGVCVLLSWRDYRYFLVPGNCF